MSHLPVRGRSAAPTGVAVAAAAGGLGSLGFGRSPARPAPPPTAAAPSSGPPSPSLSSFWTTTSHHHSIPPPPPTSSTTFSSSSPWLSSAVPRTPSAAPAATSAAACGGSTGGGAASAAAVACAASPAVAVAAVAVATSAAARALSSRLCGGGGGRQGQRRMRVVAGAWRAGSPGGSTYHEQNSNAVYGSGWDVRRAVGSAAATAAAAAALDGSGGADGLGPGGDAAGVGGGGGPDGGPPFLEFPTAEVRMSMVSERAAATCALGLEVAERMQADCIRAVRSWCKLGYGDHVVVHVEHQQLASAPGLLSSAAVTFAGPDGRRHAAVAVSVGVRTAAAHPAVAAPSQPPSPSRESVTRQFAPTTADGAAAESGPTSDPSPQRRRQRPPAAAHVAPGSSAPSPDPLPGLSLHWGCCYGPGQRWHAAAAGWHTLPAVSYDTGKGAWQTPLAVRQAIPLDLDPDPLSGGGGSNSSLGQWVAVYSLVLQLPWEGPIRDGGLCFVLKTARNQWIKARVLPPGSTGSSHGGGGSGGGEADFWIPSSALPVVANGVPLLPDVFRMSHSDSLPQVAVQQGTLPLVPEPSPHNHHRHGNDNGNGNSHTLATSPAATATAPPAAAAPSPLHPHPSQLQLSAGSTSPETPTTSAPAAAAAAAAAGASEGQPSAPSDSAPLASSSSAPSGWGSEVVDLLGVAALFRAPPRLSDVLLRPADRHPLPPPPPPPSGSGSGRRSAGPGVCVWMLDHIAQKEPFAERSLMHRYNAGADLVEMAGGTGEVAEALAGVTAWIRLSSARLLVWNRNYNVKPREIATAQARLAAALAALGAARGPAAPGGSGSAAVGALVRVALAAVGRGGAGEVGQRIRDEILAIQQRNGCKGGMMEEWHQKLHNNTSPDDVVICGALLAYIAAGLDITAYWRTLSSAGITAQRLASFDRPITSEPRFTGQQAGGLQRDLTAYLQTLQAVHGGDDLASATNNVLGYQETDMKGKRIVVPAVPHVVTPTLERHLRALLALQRHLASPAAATAAAAAAAADTTSGGSGTSPPSTGVLGRTSPQVTAVVRNSPAAVVTVTPGGAATAAAVPAVAMQRPTDVASLYGLPGAVRLMEMVVEARHLIRPFLDGGDSACGGRLVDVAFLDLALDSALRTAVEANIGPIKRNIADATAVYIAAAGKGPNGGGANGATGRGGGINGGGSVGSVLPLRGSYAAAAALTHALEVVRLTAENAALSCCPNDDLVYSNKWLRLLVAQEDPRDARDRMLQALAIAERLKRFLADQGMALMGLIQPASDALADRLKLQPAAVSGMGEEVVRGSSGAPLAQLLASLEPALRQATGGGAWQIVSRGSGRPVLAGRLRVEARLAAVQHEVMRESTVLLVEGITGAEEIPEGCVAVLVGGGTSGPGCPDVLSHSAVRARNMGVLLAGCYSAELVSRIKSHEGSRVMVRLEGADVQISFSSTGAAGATRGDGTAK